MVVSSRSIPLYNTNVEVYAGELGKLVHEHLKPKYKDVWFAGGAMLVKSLIRLNLANK